MRVGLLEPSDRKRPGRRREMMFDVPGRPLHIPPQPGAAAYRSTLRGIVSAMLSLARRQHAAAIGAPRTAFDGPRRELWASALAVSTGRQLPSVVVGLAYRVTALFGNTVRN